MLLLWSSGINVQWSHRWRFSTTTTTSCYATSCKNIWQLFDSRSRGVLSHHVHCWTHLAEPARLFQYDAATRHSAGDVAAVVNADCTDGVLKYVRVSTICRHLQYNTWGSDTIERFLSKVAFESNWRKKLSRIEHVLIVKVYFETRKIAKDFMAHGQDFFRKLLWKATFERKVSSVSLPLHLQHVHSQPLGLNLWHGQSLGGKVWWHSGKVQVK